MASFLSRNHWTFTNLLVSYRFSFLNIIIIYKYIKYYSFVVSFKKQNSIFINTISDEK